MLDIPPELQKFQIDTSEYQTVRRLGEGGFGIVQLCIDPNATNPNGILPQEDFDKRVVKMMKYNIASEDQKKSFIREIQILADSKHPNVLNLLGFTLHVSDAYPVPAIIIPYLPHGSVQDCIENEMKGYGLDWWDTTAKMKAIFGAAEGMRYLHSNGVIHRDFKPDNLLINSDYEVVITDFGLSKRLDTSDPSKMSAYQVGTLNFMAPEMLLKDSYGIAVDVYSFGLTVYSIAAGTIPYLGLPRNDVHKRVSEHTLPDFASEGLPEPLVELILHCTDEEPARRPTFRQIVDQLKELKIVLDDVDMEQYTSFIAKVSPGERENTNAPLQARADSGDIPAMLEYAKALAKGNGVSRDLVLSAYYLKMAADKGNSTAQRKYGAYLYLQGDVSTAAEYLKLASNDDAKAARKYGFMLINGIGVTANNKQGLECFKKAAQLGDVKALYNYAKMVKSQSPNGATPQDKMAIVAMYKKLVDVGNVDAMAKMGAYFYKGDFVPKDLNKAADLLKKAADSGNVKAKRRYGLCLFTGQGVQQNQQMAVSYFKESAELGDAKAMINYGTLLMKGAGVQKDQSKGEEFYKSGKAKLPPGKM